MPESTQTILPGTVSPAGPGLKGFDANTVITASLAQQFKAGGYSFCARYLSLGTTQEPGDLSYSEALAILNAGLALVAVQHVLYPGWKPTADIGTSHGANAARNAASIGLPAGMNIWCDLEGVATGTDAQDVIAYCQAWYKAAKNAGYVPGLYVGADAILEGDQLYDLSFQHYWKSLSNVPTVSTRGFQLIQSNNTTVFGVNIDTDTTETDKLGGNVLWLAV